MILARSVWYCSGVIWSARYWRNRLARRCCLSGAMGEGGASGLGRAGVVGANTALGGGFGVGLALLMMSCSWAAASASVRAAVCTELGGAGAATVGGGGVATGGR